MPHARKGLAMPDFTTSVRLDVHARSIKAVAFNVVSGKASTASFGCDTCAVAERAAPWTSPPRRSTNPA